MTHTAQNPPLTPQCCNLRQISALLLHITYSISRRGGVMHCTAICRGLQTYFIITSNIPSFTSNLPLASPFGNVQAKCYLAFVSVLCTIIELERLMLLNESESVCNYRTLFLLELKLFMKLSTKC